MKEYLISQFIDDELDLDEKVEFVETVHHSKAFTEETIDLLHQEKLLQGDLDTPVPNVQAPRPRPAMSFGLLRGLLPPLAGFVTAALLVTTLFLYQDRPASEPVLKEPYRFVLYEPEAGQAELVGSFTGWTPVAMNRIGNSGYWALTLDLPPGEHRYSYLVANGRRIADPTVPSREQDDFGGENSVIEVHVPI